MTKPKKYYCIEQDQNGLWYQVKHSASKVRAEQWLASLRAIHGGKWHIVHTWPSSDYPAISPDPRKNPIIGNYAATVAKLLVKTNSIKPAGKARKPARKAVRKNPVDPTVKKFGNRYDKNAYRVDTIKEENFGKLGSLGVWRNVAVFASKGEAFEYAKAAEKLHGGAWRVCQK